MSSAHVTEQELVATCAIGKTYTMSHNVPQESRSSVELFIGTYEAVRKATASIDVALYVAAHEAARTIAAKPARGKFEKEPAKFFSRDNVTPGAIAGYCRALIERLESVVREAPLQSVTVGARTYTLSTPPDVPQLVGLDRERAQLLKYLRQAFLYEPAKAMNEDRGRFPEKILLTGPPGTGKSSLLRHVYTEGKRLSSITQIPFTFVLYDSAHFSSYFGRSQRVLKQKLAQAKDPSGVGVFAIEDVDMVLQSRDDAHKIHGVQQVQQFLLNELSGFNPSIGNLITILSTNKPEHLDDAIRSRCEDTMPINPFTMVNIHLSYFAQEFPSLMRSEQQRLAELTHQAHFTGRDLSSVKSLAKQSTTREPTDEELRTRHSSKDRYGAVTAELLETIIAERIVARRS